MSIINDPSVQPESDAALAPVTCSAANVFIVSVLPEAGTQRCKRYKVRCHSADDAIQLAFALDGGWGKDRDASDMLQLAKAYCHVVKQQNTAVGIQKDAYHEKP